MPSSTPTRWLRVSEQGAGGVGVIFYVLIGTCTLEQPGDQTRRRTSPSCWILSALGSVADVVPLDANSRILVHQGLERIRAGRARPGLKAILEVAKHVTTRKSPRLIWVLFLGPRLNAAGRLDDRPGY